MKIIITICMLLLPAFITLGQDSRVSLGVTGSTDFYNIDFLPVEAGPATFDTDFNYSIGASARYQFNDNLGLNLKITYATRDFTLNHNYRFIDLNDPLFFQLPRQTSANLSYLDFPISVNYAFLKKNRFDIFFSAGVAPGVLLTNDESTVFEDNREEKTESITNDDLMNSLLVSGTFGAGIKYHLIDKLDIILEPQYRYFFNRISDGNEDNTPQLFSIALGAELRL